MKAAPPYKLEVRSHGSAARGGPELTINQALRMSATDVLLLERTSFRIRDSIRRGEARKLEASLSALSFVEDARFDAHCEVLTVGLLGGQEAANSVEDFLDERGVRVVREVPGTLEDHAGETDGPVPLGVYLSVLGLIAGAVHTYGSSLSLQVRDLALNLQAILAGALLCWAGVGSLRSVLDSLLRGRFRPETLPLLMGTGIILASIVTFFKGGTPRFEAGLIAFGGSLLLCWLNTRGRVGSRRRLLDLGALLEGQTMVLGPDGLFRVPRESVRAGDVAIVGPQGVIPADGVVQEGSAFLAEAVTSPFMTHKQCTAGDRVWAGMTVATGNLAIRVDGRNQRSSLAHVHSHMAEIGFDEAWMDERMQSVLIRYSGILLAGTAGLLWAARHYGDLLGQVNSLDSALSVVLVAIPFVFARPYTGRLLDTACQLARYGAIPRDLESVSLLSDLESVQVHADGTLTCDEPEVESWILDEGSSREEVLGLTLSLTEGTSHGIHRCLNRFAREAIEDVNESPPIQGVTDLGYLGRTGDAETRLAVALVEAKELAALGVGLVNRPWRLTAGEARGQAAIRGKATTQAVLYLTQGAQVLARFHVFDPIRAEARDTVHAMESLGVSVCLAAEGDEERVVSIAGDVGIALRHTSGASPPNPAGKGSALVVGQTLHAGTRAHGLCIRFGGAMGDVSLQAHLTVLNDSMNGITSGLRRLKVYQARTRRGMVWTLVYAVPSTLCAGLGLIPIATAATMSLVFTLFSMRLTGNVGEGEG
jgi:Cu2+-exporting ATPase